MLNRKSSPNKTTANNLDNPQHNLSSASSGRDSQARSDKTNSVDEDDRPPRVEPRFLSSDDFSGLTQESPERSVSERNDVGLNGI